MNGTQINAGTYGDIIFVRPEHAADVRTSLEELEHVKRNLDGRARKAASIVELEIDARERPHERAEEFGLQDEAIDETLREIEIMRRRGCY
jgi:rRNA-processing protein FCF1